MRVRWNSARRSRPWASLDMVREVHAGSENNPPRCAQGIARITQKMTFMFGKGLSDYFRELNDDNDRLRAALKAVEWRGHQGKCPLCAGWNMSPQGETPGKHTKDCLVAIALTDLNSETAT